MIKFMYFDVGGVVIKDFSETDKWEEYKTTFNITDEYWESISDDLTTGKVGISLEMIEGFVNRFEPNKSLWPIYSKITCPKGLLTNQYPGLLTAIFEKGLMPDTEWDEIIDSAEVGLAKPDRKIFELAQKRAGLSGKEILFVDNSKKHLETANELGWQTFFYDSKDYNHSSLELINYYLKNGL